MLLDLLSADMYANYNIKVAQIMGLHEAIYLAELLSINRKALNKNKIEENGFFNVDRKYITQRTTLKTEEQLELDQKFKNLEVLEIGSKSNNIKINVDTLTGILLDKNEQIVETIVADKLGKKMTKKEIILKALKTNITATNEELIEAYSEWIDAVYSKNGWMSKKAIVAGQNRVDEYSCKDLDVALKIIELATINGYRDMEYAITLFERKYKSEFEKAFREPNVQIIPTRTTLSTDEVF